MSTCRPCNAPIRWVSTTGGKPMPLDAVDGSPFGNSVAVKWHVRTADVDCVTVVPGSSEVAETDAVQVRRRLSLAEVNEQPKAVA